MYIQTNTTKTTIRPHADYEAGQECLDCLFWYRCKQGKIDCEIKHV